MRAIWLMAFLMLGAFMSACSGGEPSSGTWDRTGRLPVPTAGVEPTPPDPTPVEYPRPCGDIYAQDLLPTFELEITDSVWAALHEDFMNDQKIYRPAEFRYEGEEYPDVMVRYRGNNSRCGEKIQLVISFKQINEDGRFHGLKRLNLDHGGCKLLDERLTLEFMRELGVPAACANHARLVVNGEYYGLFTNIEHVNKDFLKRNFAEYGGNLYKRGKHLKTNEGGYPDTSRLADFWDAADVGTLSELADLEQSIVEWSAEAMMPAVDNYILNGWNYYLYDHPTRGFLFIPNDLDQSLPKSSSWDLDPLDMIRVKPANFVVADPVWRAAYLDALTEAHATYDPDHLEARIHEIWNQILPAAADDPFLDLEPDSKPSFSLRQHIRNRSEWIGKWLDCEVDGVGCGEVAAEPAD